MSIGNRLDPGFNITTERIDETPEELPALAFLRRVAADQSIQTPVTVTGLEDLLYYAASDDRDEVITSLRQTLRSTSSLSSSDAVQFYIDGRIVEDNRFRIRIERGGEAVYLEIGEMFVEEPRLLTPEHAVARK
jgi:hypothetical protein